VNYKIYIIEQHPLRLLVAFDIRRPLTGTAESLLYLIRDGLNLPRVATRADNKEICERAGILVQFQNCDVFGFLIFAGVNGFEHLASVIIGFPDHPTSCS